MKILVSSKGKDENSLMDPRFGRCEFFYIYDSEKNDFNIIENKGFVSNEGAGVAAASQVIDEDVNVVITGSIGPNVFKLFKKCEIKMYKGNNKSVKDLIFDFQNEKLEEIQSSGPSHNGINA